MENVSHCGYHRFRHHCPQISVRISSSLAWNRSTADGHHQCVSRRYLNRKKEEELTTSLSLSEFQQHLCVRYKMCRIDDVTSRRDFCCALFVSSDNNKHTKRAYFRFDAVSNVHGCVCARRQTSLLASDCVRLCEWWVCECEESQHSYPNGLKCFQMDQQRKNYLVNVNANANYNENLKHITCISWANYYYYKWTFLDHFFDN